MNALLSDSLLQPTPRPGVLHVDVRALWLCRACGAYRWHYGEWTSTHEVTFYADRPERDPERCQRCQRRHTRMVRVVCLPAACEDVMPRRKGAIRAGWKVDLS